MRGIFREIQNVTERENGADTQAGIRKDQLQEEGEMKKGIIATLLSAAMVLTMLPVSAAPEDSDDSQGQAVVLSDDEGLGTNVAPKATADASYTNVWYISPAAMNDGSLATSNSSTSWNSWGGSEENYPVTVSLSWDTESVLSGMRVIWWAIMHP